MPDIEEAPTAEIEDQPKRPRGRPRKDGAPIGSRSTTAPLIDIANPPRKQYYSDSTSPAQKTAAAWKWGSELRPSIAEQIDITVYRSWPVLLDPTEDWCGECKLIMAADLLKCPRCGEKLKAQEYKYIDKLLGRDFPKNDQDFIDRYGAGDYCAYVNVSPDTTGGQRRTLMICFVKGSHDFKTYPPTDRRIDQLANLSITDPANAAYVAWLRSQGKVPDEQKDLKEREDMAASGVLVDKLIDRVDKLTDRVIENAEKEPPAGAPSETPQQQTLGMFDIIERLQRLTQSGNSNAPDVGAIMQSAIAMAQAISKANDPSAYLQKISELETQVRKQEADARQRVLDEIRDEVRALKANPQTSVTTTDGSNLQVVVEKAVKKVVEDLGIGGEDAADKTPWWVSPLISQGIPFLTALTQRLLMPNTPPAPAGVGFPGPVAQQPNPGQPALAAPSSQAQPQSNPQQAAQPQATPEQMEIHRILTAISAPVIESLSNGESGDDFADFVSREFGAQGFRLISKFSEEEILGALNVFPLIAPRITAFPQETVKKFVHDFKVYSPEEYDKKMDAKDAEEK